MLQKRLFEDREEEGRKASGMYCWIIEKKVGGKGRNVSNL